MEKCKRIENPQLPEAMIQHIQSFMSGKEAARTTLLSHSWHNAWLTRPSLVFDERDSAPDAFEESAVKTIQRYRDLNLKIENFALHRQSFRRGNSKPLAGKLIVDAVKLGATHLNLQLPSTLFRLPPEVLNSKTLLQLSVKGCGIDGGSVECPMLKSLSLERVILSNDDMISDIISCCVSIEEISLSNPSNSMVRKLGLSGKENQYELHKLKRLYLEMVNVHNSFFGNFGSRFPCLNDLSLVGCDGYKRVHIYISSTSLQRISIVQGKTLRAEFDVPNLVHFSYGGKSIPSITIEAKKWDSSISINCKRSHTSAWYLALLKMLNKLSSSRISLSLNYAIGMCWNTIDDEVDFELPSKPVAVENLTIEAPFDCGHYLLAGLFWICHPKIVTHYWLPRDSCKHWLKNNESLNHVCKHLSEEAINMDVYDREYNLFGRFDIEEVNVEVYEEVLTEWKPLLLKEHLDALMAPPNKRKVRFGLKWTAGIALERI